MHQDEEGIAAHVGDRGEVGDRVVGRDLFIAGTADIGLFVAMSRV
jgi:hypothetical protein